MLYSLAFSTVVRYSKLNAVVNGVRKQNLKQPKCESLVRWF